MAWVKIPKEHHPLFHAALPKDPRITTLLMFGSIAAKANGHMFGGLFARSAFVKLSAEDQQRALALDGAEPFDPLGNRRVMSNAVTLPETVMEDPEELRTWLRRAFDYAIALPAKPAAKARPAAKLATKPAAKPRGKQPAAPSKARASRASASGRAPARARAR